MLGQSVSVLVVQAIFLEVAVWLVEDGHLNQAVGQGWFQVAHAEGFAALKEQGGSADQLQVAQCGVMGESVRHETSLIKSYGVSEHLSSEIYPVVEIETSFKLAGIIH